MDTAGIVPTLRNRLRAHFRESGHLPGAVTQAMQTNQIRDDAIRRSFEITDDEDENFDETQEDNNTTVINEQNDTNRRELVDDPMREREDGSADGTRERVRNAGAGTGQISGEGVARETPVAPATGGTDNLNPGNGTLPRDARAFTSTPRPAGNQTTQGAPAHQEETNLSLTELIKQEIAKAMRETMAFDNQTPDIGVGAGLPRANSTVNHEQTTNTQPTTTETTPNTGTPSYVNRETWGQYYNSAQQPERGNANPHQVPRGEETPSSQPVPPSNYTGASNEPPWAQYMQSGNQPNLGGGAGSNYQNTLTNHYHNAPGYYGTTPNYYSTQKYGIPPHFSGAVPNYYGTPPNFSGAVPNYYGTPPTHPGSQPNYPGTTHYRPHPTSIFDGTTPSYGGPQPNYNGFAPNFHSTQANFGHQQPSYHGTSQNSSEPWNRNNCGNQQYSREYRPNLTTTIDTLRKWNLKFSGREDPDAFLHRLREARFALRLSDVDLLTGLPCLLTGLAAEWCRDKRRGWSTYAHFEDSFRRRWLDPDYQYSILTDIERRTQGKQEPVANYLTSIKGLMNRAYPQWPEHAIVDQAYRNMLPKFHTVIDRDLITSFEQLEATAIRRERMFTTAQLYQAPPAPDKSLVSSLAYQPPRAPRQKPSELHLVDENSATEEETDTEEVMTMKTSRKVRPTRPHQKNTDNRGPSTREAPAPSDAREPRPPLLCHNCDSPDHLVKDCTAPRKIRCFICKKEGYTKDNCPNCTGNGGGSK